MRTNADNQRINDDEIDLRLLIGSIRKKLHFFLISAAIFSIGAFLYIRFTLPIYEACEVQFGLAGGVAPQAHAFVGEGFAHVIIFALVRKVAARRDHFHLVVGGIDQRFVGLVEPALAGLVKLGRTLLVE